MIYVDDGEYRICETCLVGIIEGWCDCYPLEYEWVVFP